MRGTICYVLVLCFWQANCGDEPDCRARLCAGLVRSSCRTNTKASSDVRLCGLCVCAFFLPQ